ncbi:MAG: NAD-dependent epimerase [Cyclobacteriaceae bacterium]|nr:NAD-dependent epimerase [Cyclobacteriaceae bacterium]
MNILITGVAGFVGHHVMIRLLQCGYNIVGLDQINDYYDSLLKLNRLTVQGLDMQKISNEKVRVSSSSNSDIKYTFYRSDLEDVHFTNKIFTDNHFDAVIHLAAQAGVRYSIDNPRAYIQSNIAGFMNILEGCRDYKVKHLIYASSSSVYGANKEMPFSTNHAVDHPVSLYAATKKANELMAHTYSHLYGVPTTGLRFFTVYGPWGRPDMAYFSFTKDILEGRPIKVFNEGQMSRDFTYIDDIVESIVRLIPLAPSPNPDWDTDHPTPASSYAPYRVLNIGNNSPVNLMEFIGEIESALGMEAEKIMMPMQPGDVPTTWADTSELIKLIGFTPKTPLKEGVQKFVAWYRSYYNV